MWSTLDVSIFRITAGSRREFPRCSFFNGVSFPTTGVGVISGDWLLPPDVVFPVVTVSFPCPPPSLPGVGLCNRDVVGLPKVAGFELGSLTVGEFVGFCCVGCTRVLLVCCLCMLHVWVAPGCYTDDVKRGVKKMAK